MPVPLRCTDCKPTKRTNWQFSSVQFSSVHFAKSTKRVQFILFALYTRLITVFPVLLTNAPMS